MHDLTCTPVSPTGILTTHELMADNTHQRPSLASILSTLSQFTTQTRPSPARWAENAKLEPERLAVAGDSFDVHNPEPGLQGGDLTKTSVFSRNGGKSKPPPPTPVTITEWPVALRCVMRTVAPNEAALANIRKVRHAQPAHPGKDFAHPHIDDKNSA